MIPKRAVAKVISGAFALMLPNAPKELLMNTRFVSFAAMALLATVASAGTHADTLASSVGVYIYPAKDQSAEQQGKDDYECFGWAKGQTGYDPLNPPPATAAAPAQQQASGSRLRGAARGAVGGAIIGEVAGDDGGKGAAIGATLGVMRRCDRPPAERTAGTAGAAIGPAASCGAARWVQECLRCLHRSAGLLSQILISATAGAATGTRHTSFVLCVARDTQAQGR